MDYKEYRLTWRQEKEGDELPAVRLPALAMQWDLQFGGHPSLLVVADAFYQRNPFQDTRNPKIDDDLQIPPIGTVHGHNTLSDVGYTTLIDVDISIPTSPLFVKDLCGRTIYIGYGPERKTPDDWAAYSANKLVKEGDEVDLPNLLLATITFPQNCWEVTDDLPNADLIENVFFCKFRTLDMSFDFTAMPSGHGEELAAGIYANANLYPYKIRPDTFYTDGYKLPQTNMVFAKQNVEPFQAKQAAQQLEYAWEAAQNNAQSYEAFVATQQSKIDSWYDAGCTLIPTFEACNGFNQVGRNFELIDYHAGQAVAGLHEVKEVRDSETPPGTILAVLAPGYVTAWEVKPAQVIVSNGSGYVSLNETDPNPLLPNLVLPHQRASSQWGSTWLPTHPLHFELPAIWGWEGTTGHFVQLSGPLWDPLHYYYESTDLILAALEHPLRENTWLADVPEEMDNRFYPIVPMQGFDTLDENERMRRYEKMLLPRSAAKRVRPGIESAPVGYHPLPLQFEYELDPYWFPELAPTNRNLDECPTELLDLLAGVINSQVRPQEYLETVQGPEECVWLNSIDFLTPSSKQPLEDYPFLVRYLVPDLPEEEIFKMSAGLFLEDIPDDVLNAKPEEIWPEVDGLEALEDLAPGLFDAVWDMREEALRLVRTRHRLYRRNPGLYAYAWWLCVGAKELEQFFIDWEEKEAAKGRGPDRSKIPLGSQIMPVSSGDLHNTQQSPKPQFQLLED